MAYTTCGSRPKNGRDLQHLWVYRNKWAGLSTHVGVYHIVGAYSSCGCSPANGRGLHYMGVDTNKWDRLTPHVVVQHLVRGTSTSWEWISPLSQQLYILGKHHCFILTLTVTETLTQFPDDLQRHIFIPCYYGKRGMNVNEDLMSPSGH